MPDFFFSINSILNYSSPPFHPNKRFIEFGNIFNEFDKSNLLYEEIRNLFILSGLDKDNIATEKWNPFRGLVKDKDNIVIKPNLVFEERGKLIGTKCITTNGNVIRPIIDYLILLQRTENIKLNVFICDVPIQGANFNKILYDTGISSLYKFYNENYDLNLSINDLRLEIAIEDNNNFFYRQKVDGDPNGYSTIHLGKSFLDDIIKDHRKFCVSGYGFENASGQHSQKAHHYYHIPNTILNADLFINIPKIKTHKKAGITVALKNLIGIVGDKSWIPHYRKGSIKYGGDEYDDKNVFLKSTTTKAILLLQGKSNLLWNLAKGFNKNIIKRYFRPDCKKQDLTAYERKRKFLINGDWYGNDTIWRPILDLNYLLYFSDKNGIIKDTPQRKYIVICDGVISGEGDGPLEPDPKNVGLLCLSFNPFINDLFCSKLMGFDWEKIPKLNKIKEINDLFSFNIEVKDLTATGVLDDMKKDFNYQTIPNLKFLPPPGWVNHIELSTG